jgi:hypothetical protein
LASVHRISICLNWQILYEDLASQPSESLWKLNATFLQIGNLIIPKSNDWLLRPSEILR